MGLRNFFKRRAAGFRRSTLKAFHALAPGDTRWELRRLVTLPRSQPGYTDILGKPFKFHDGASFAVTYKEIFRDEIYKFHSVSPSKLILDCGANMGLSVLYFALNYPQHRIIAFEPEKETFEILRENVATFGLTNVTLYQKAVWTKSEVLTFYSDGGMGGRVGHKFDYYTPPVRVEAVPLSDYLEEPVDFLKIDIEGAEDIVIKSCRSLLGRVDHIFFEYHSVRNAPQTLHELLQIVHEAGFAYHIKESATRNRPFIDTDTFCDRFDMAITIFCKRARS